VYRDDDVVDDDDDDDMITTHDEQDDDDEDDGMTDMSKCMQFVGGAGSVSSLDHFHGCGICVLWLIHQSRLHPNKDISGLLHQMIVY
jgi:hypothetical protein